MIDMQVDGLLLVAPRTSGNLLARYAAQCQMVAVGHHEKSAQAFDTVNSDDEAGAKLAVNALLANGCRRVHMLSLPRINENREVFAFREKGYLAAMAAAGLSDQAHIFRVQERPNGPGEPLDAISDGGILPDGLFCWSDLHAIAVLNAAHERDIPVPSCLAIVGYDSTPATAMPLIGMSSVEHGGETLRRLAAKSLLSRIAGRTEPKHTLVEPSLLKRRSLAC